MAKDPLALRRAGLISFAIGILLGILLILACAWPDMEAQFYGFVKYTNEPLKSLRCPVLMTTKDRLPVTIRLNNPNDKVITRVVQAQFSTRLTVDTVQEKVELQPGETKTLSWEVGEENVDLKRFIFARVFTYPATSLPMTDSSCGTMVLRLPFKGGLVIFYGAVLLAAIGMGAGFWLWLRHSDLSEPAVVTQSWQMRFIAVVIAVGVLVSYIGIWILAVLALTLALVSFSVFLMPRKN